MHYLDPDKVPSPSRTGFGNGLCTVTKQFDEILRVAGAVGAFFVLDGPVPSLLETNLL